MLKLVKRDWTPYWIIRGRIGGGRIEESTGTTDRARAEEVLSVRSTEIHRAAVFGPEATATFARAVNLYLDGGGEERFVAPLLKALGPRLLSSIGQEDVELVARKSYPRAAAATVNRQVVTPLRAILRIAEDAGLGRAPRLKPRKTRQPKRVAASREWLAAVIANAPPHLGALMQVNAQTGARLGELLELREADLDLPRGEAYVGRTKTDTPRRLTLSPESVAMIANLARDSSDPQARVFGYARRQSIYGSLQRACARAGVPYIPPHQSGRHTYATMLLKNGQSLATVTKAGGWKSAALVVKTYAHLEQSETDKASRALGGGWGGGVMSLAERRRKTASLK